MKCPCCGGPLETATNENTSRKGPGTEYCPACKQDLWKLRESVRIKAALSELAEQMEGFEPAAAPVHTEKD